MIANTIKLERITGSPNDNEPLYVTDDMMTRRPRY